MRILVLGAGAVGGYFGGRLLEAGRDVTFLVRPGRAEQLARTGLVIRSEAGADVARAAPSTVQAGALRGPFDLVIVSCKAYDLAESIEAIGPAVGPETAVLPLLNGLRHLDALDARFGPDRVLGGRCFITARLDDAGRILHTGPFHELAYGGRNSISKPLAMRIEPVLADAGFESRLSDRILDEMWEKWVFLAAFAGATCLFRASVGDIVAAGGSERVLELLSECQAIAALNGFGARTEWLTRSRKILTAPGSPAVSSMLGDIERGSARTEADHILGDLLRRGQSVGVVSTQLLRTALAALRSHEVRMAREGPHRVVALDHPA